MTWYDVHDEAVLDATPEQILQALVDESQGRSNWWQPGVRMRQVGDVPITEVGGVIEFVVLARARRGGVREVRRFTARVVGTDGGRELTLRVFDGDFRGVENWTFDRVGEDHTRIGLHWSMKPHGRVRLIARFVDVRVAHSKVVQEAFGAVEAYVRGQQPAA
jgi:hypothetical protein